ncbi:MAG: hypothetical protein AAF692_11140, partial [Pseudomonadota bacterium]
MSQEIVELKGAPETTPLPANYGRMNAQPMRAIIPQTMEDCFRLGQLIHRSGWAPSNVNADGCAIAILHGLEVGLPPMQAVQGIA